METARTNYLLKAYLSDTLSSVEREELLFLLQSASKETELVENMQELIDELTQAGQLPVDIPSQTLWQALSQDARLQPDMVYSIGRQTKWKWMSVAAAVLILAGAFFYDQSQVRVKGAKESSVVAKQKKSPKAEVIAPGKQDATLTLPDGQIIVMNDLINGKSVKGENFEVSIENGQIRCHGLHGQPVNMTTTLRTPRGGEYQLNLPDGTEVWLNASSSITYPINFAHDRREVQIEGEAYFHVKKDLKRPFTVHAEKTAITVLGTQFNVSAYPEQKNIKTTLVEGSVELHRGNLVRKLHPGEEANTTKGELEQIKIQTVDVEEAIAWKNGYFYFHNENVKEAMEKIARWYNVEVVFQGNVPKKGLDGTISRLENLNQLLQALEMTGAAHFTLQERRIIVSE